MVIMYKINPVCYVLGESQTIQNGIYIFRMAMLPYSYVTSVTTRKLGTLLHG